MPAPFERSVDVLICTFRRPSVTDTLRSVAAQDLPAGTSLRIVVADNDATPSSRETVLETAQSLSVPVHYVHAPQSNISIARNACLDVATADWVAFIDDDETADPGWLRALLARADDRDADAVFGPALAEYPPDAPQWMARQDLHSNHPVSRNGVVETGHTCNALLRFAGTPWEAERFALERGRSGGEDTEFFFRLHRLGACFAIAETAIVREDVSAERMRMRWLLSRRFRMGQSHAARAHSLGARIKLAGTATAKAAYCALCATGRAGATEQRNFWTLRMALHWGVAAGCLHLPQAQLYGGDQNG